MSQFKNNQGKELVKKLKVKLSNLSEVEKNTSYRYVVTDDKDQAIGNYDGGSSIYHPYILMVFRHIILILP